MKLSLFGLVSISTCVCAQDCILPLDVMFLQDTTGSQDKIIDIMTQQVPLVYAGVSSVFPDTFFGVAEFQDKPYWPLGQPEGFCYKLAQPFTDNMDAIVEAYSYLYASGGGDRPEAQYQAIINAALDPAAGWRPLYSSGDMTNTAGGRIIIMATDAVPHLNGDMAKFQDWPDVPQGLPANSGGISTDDITYECLYQEYPSPAQLKAALKATDTSLIIMSPDDPAIVPVWSWVNADLLGQPDNFYIRSSATSKDLYELLVDLLQQFVKKAPCPATTTAPPPPTQSLPTTNLAPTQPPSSPAPTASGDASGTTVGSDTADLSSGSAQCRQCPCVVPGPCSECPAGCEGAAVVVRLAKEPKKLQLIVNNE